MDSSGLALLLSVANQGVRVQLRDPSPAVRQVVELTGLADMLVIEP
ncbi:MAG: STAS domain-containing protein [Acidimicrobiales bacterium]